MDEVWVTLESAENLAISSDSSLENKKAETVSEGTKTPWA